MKARLELVKARLELVKARLELVAGISEGFNESLN